MLFHNYIQILEKSYEYQSYQLSQDLIILCLTLLKEQKYKLLFLLLQFRLKFDNISIAIKNKIINKLK